MTGRDRATDPAERMTEWFTMTQGERDAWKAGYDRGQAAAAAVPDRAAPTGARTYFDMVRSMTDDPEILAAVDKAEAAAPAEPTEAETSTLDERTLRVAARFAVAQFDQHGVDDAPPAPGEPQ